MEDVIESLQKQIVELNADLRKSDSRVEAYQRTCHQQGTKLSRIEALLMAESDEANKGMDVSSVNLHIVHWTDEKLRAIAAILLER